ncbi:30S ribosomal protein S9 [Mariniblastus sp.]|jgi:small subunit ribosomal protein S9|nr:30S ribosomal protein S9 [Planctomycetaceae bacterium]MDA7887520.1 30S ribosomal protein S9 [bacterium]MDA7903522.1 30S ribosomal protein S9 [Mariniblastus sp.]MCP4477678.1 30S ribosomal protein S9 [Planctomycetaceae bacterium]MCP4773875.1 30S ribosomal protein S9 [Planctomycetaceae bacterium]|eukprot:COSAG01_NODE_148_length_24037_cov_219.235859_15_plen_136_part_00
MAKTDQKTGESLGTGRRKSSVARVRVKTGSGTIVVNGKPLNEYFPVAQDQRAIIDTLNAVGSKDSLDIRITVSGGGTTGQSGACKMGIARALVNLDEENFSALRDGGFLTRDSRMKERKKPGLHGARRGTQFSKR